MDNPYELTDTPNNTETDVTDVAGSETPNLADMDDPMSMAATDAPTLDGFIRLTPPPLTLSQALTPINISLDDDDNDPPTDWIEADYTDDDHDPHIPNTFTLGETALPPDLEARTNTSQIAPDTVVEPELDTGEVTDDGDDPIDRAAEATLNISLAALGDTIRQQIETQQQEINERLSLLYAQRAELTERIAATGDNAPQGT